MALRTSNKSIFRNVDYSIIIIYALLVIAGAISIYAASYDFDNASMLDLSEFSGKQFGWIILSFGIGTAILMLDDWFFETYAYLIYYIIIVLLVVTIFIAPNIKGSHSWIVLGPVSLQPAEFAKFATALALAKLFNGYNFSLNAKASNYIKAAVIIFLPIVLILLQNETGSALVFTSLIFVLYREGMSGLILYAGLCAIVIFVVGLKYSAIEVLGVSGGEFIVMVLILLMIMGMTLIYCRNSKAARNIFFIYAGICTIYFGLMAFDILLNGRLLIYTALAGAIGYLIFEMTKKEAKKLAVTVTFAIASVLFLFSINYVFSEILGNHQQMRIKVALGIEEDLRGAGYNVNQSKIAIGSGGFWGKGFLNGTQTKLKYVPEQHTDFIFCTIGEEEGFVGTSLVLITFMMLILKIIQIAERQHTAFGRVYGYCVASYLLFHLGINIGMVVGLCPVIGIPLPFFSYGGSSLLAFTLLLFILLKIDASRTQHNY